MALPIESFLPKGGYVGQFKPTEVPKTAVSLDHNVVLRLQEKAIAKWVPAYEMYPLKFGAVTLGVMSSISGALFTGLLRPKFFLGNKGFVTTFLPNIILPSFTALVAHHTGITTKLMTNQFNCSICAQTRAMIYQFYTAGPQPYFLAVISCAMAANLHKTSPLPHWKDWRGNLKMVAEMARPFHSTTLLIFLVNCVAALVVTDRENRAIRKVWEKMAGQQGDLEQALIFNEVTVTEEEKLH